MSWFVLTQEPVYRRSPVSLCMPDIYETTRHGFGDGTGQAAPEQSGLPAITNLYADYPRVGDDNVPTLLAVPPPLSEPEAAPEEVAEDKQAAEEAPEPEEETAE